MAKYQRHNLSIFDNVYAPRYYMGLMLCQPLPTFAHAHCKSLVEDLRLAANMLTEKVPALLGDIMLDPIDRKSGKMVLHIPRKRDTTSNTVFRCVEHDDNKYSYSNLLDNDFDTKVVPADIFAPFPASPGTEKAHAVCGIQANIVRGGLILIFCLHHAFTDAVFARQVVSAFYSILTRKPHTLPSSFEYSLSKLEHALQTDETRNLLRLCPERFIKPTPPINIRQRSSTMQPRMGYPFDDYAFSLPTQPTFAEYVRQRTVSQPVRPTPTLTRELTPAELATPTVPSPQPDPKIRHIKIPFWLLENLKASVLVHLPHILTKGEEMPKISTDDCIAALVWAHAATTGTQPSTLDETRRLFIPVDCRRRLTKTLIPENYIGNATLTVPTSCPLSLLLQARNGRLNTASGRALARIAVAIRTSISGVDDAFVRQRLALAKSVLGLGEDVRKLLLDIDLAGGRDMVWNNLRFVSEGLRRLGGFYRVRRVLPGAVAGVMTVFGDVDGGLEVEVVGSEEFELTL